MIFVIAGVISVFDAPSHVLALGFFRAFIVEPILVAAVLLNVITTPFRAYLVLGGFCLAALVLGVPNAIYVADAIRHHSWDFISAPPVIIYTSQNGVALYLVPILAVAGAIAVHAKEPRARIAFGLASLILAICAVMIFSRGGWLALAAVVLGLAISHRWRMLWLSAMFVVGIGAALVPGVLTRAMQDMPFTKGQTYNSRTILWHDSIQMLLQRPILGAGLRGFKDRMGVLENKYELPPLFPHNIVLNFWSEMGLLGLFSFAAILGIVMWKTFIGWRRSQDSWKAIELGVLLFMVAIVVHGAIDNPYFNNDLSIEFWGAVGVAFAGLRPER